MDWLDEAWLKAKPPAKGGSPDLAEKEQARQFKKAGARREWTLGSMALLQRGIRGGRKPGRTSAWSERERGDSSKNKGGPGASEGDKSID